MWASNTWSLSGVSEQGASGLKVPFLGFFLHRLIPYQLYVCPPYALLNHIMPFLTPDKLTTATYVPFSFHLSAIVSAKCARLSPYYID